MVPAPATVDQRLICWPCAKLYGRSDDPDLIVTAQKHPICRCAWCGQSDIPVTDYRNFGYPKLPVNLLDD